MIISERSNTKQLLKPFWNDLLDKKEVSAIAEGDATVKLVSLIELVKRRCEEQNISVRQSTSVLPSIRTLGNGLEKETSSKPKLKIGLQVIEETS
ncbi:RNase P and RNase MRP subunit Pop6/Pop7-like protein [Schizosaccharomyces osmophilus]|uniref:RNase P and RNase MRP subunit Pop6/Pop7-like protein n=1 Tax=Schizosaccharomyces osmophilus TaxID=2545709 RepID=A0AAF0ATF9_9SCHI|nr:RNase P and RNase MRP subunit Pop6/Pop7-like protein [Schizosaccharomyces osmophilus]WBW70697.1 RNase P and RNase MRP subunit Pop6/Pop7-like protein [Schizosaccharomyces osmophilus]